MNENPIKIEILALLNEIKQSLYEYINDNADDIISSVDEWNEMQIILLDDSFPKNKEYDTVYKFVNNYCKDFSTEKYSKMATAYQLLENN